MMKCLVFNKRFIINLVKLSSAIYRNSRNFIYHCEFCHSLHEYHVYLKCLRVAMFGIFSSKISLKNPESLEQFCLEKPNHDLVVILPKRNRSEKSWIQVVLLMFIYLHFFLKLQKCQHSWKLFWVQEPERFCGKHFHSWMISFCYRNERISSRPEATKSFIRMWFQCVKLLFLTLVQKLNGK